EALNRVQDLVRSVHDLSHRLHPSRLRLIGLVAALQGLQREVSVSGIDVTLTHEDVPAILPPDLTLCLFRVVQEALQNAVKYSGARHVLVHLAGKTEELVLTIADDGTGFDVGAAWGKGLGLVSMSERLEAVGGTLEIHSERGAGTRLEIRAPLRFSQASQSVAVLRAQCRFCIAGGPGPPYLSRRRVCGPVRGKSRHSDRGTQSKVRRYAGTPSAPRRRSRAGRRRVRKAARGRLRGRGPGVRRTGAPRCRRISQARYHRPRH